MNQTGPQFLANYCVLAIIALLAAMATRKLCLFNRIQPLSDADIDEYDIAYLSGGAERAFLSGVALLDRNGLCSIKGRTLEPRTVDLAVLSRLHPFERRIYDAAKTKVSIQQVFKDLHHDLNAMENKLTRWKLLASPQHVGMTVLASSCVLLSLPVGLGIPKMLIGLERGKPVLFLVLLVGISMLVSLILLNRGMPRTRCGDLLLSQMQTDNAALRTNFESDPSTLSSQDMTLAYALFGAAFLGLADPFMAARAALRPQVNTSSCGGGSSGGGCGSSSGGSCGGGGCGGGCGGCGGG